MQNGLEAACRMRHLRRSGGLFDIRISETIWRVGPILSGTFTKWTRLHGRPTKMTLPSFRAIVPGSGPRDAAKAVARGPTLAFADSNPRVSWLGGWPRETPEPDLASAVGSSKRTRTFNTSRGPRVLAAPFTSHIVPSRLPAPRTNQAEQRESRR
jgi:hypothetical protein